MNVDATTFIKSNSRLDLKNDYVFKRIFSKPENSHELKELLEAILDIKIDKIEVKNPEIPKSYSEEKQSTLDILAYLDDHTVVNIEMQLDNPYTIINRNVTLTDRIEYHYIELKKFIKKNPGISKKLEQWLWLLVGEEDKVKMVSKENKSIEKVVEDLDEMSGNEVERWEAFKRRYAEWEYNYTIAQSKEEGIAEEKKAIAKKMKQENINLDLIIKVTGLTKEEIEEL